MILLANNAHRCKKDDKGMSRLLGSPPSAKKSTKKLTPIMSPWPFYKWGIDIAGPFLEGPGKVKFLIVAIDYFTKWIKAKPIATITSNQIKKFVWDTIVCRFGLPREILSDNGPSKKGPAMSIPHLKNGHGDIIGVNFFVDFLALGGEPGNLDIPLSSFLHLCALLASSILSVWPLLS
nr:reverse transcriptase domain-containing protein [Tanacetum cinerariifolium]